MTNGIGRVGWRTYVSPISPLWNNLVAYYSGDNTTNDLKGTNNATLVNGATYGTGKIGSGFQLDGINDYVSIPNGTFNPTSGSYTISTWISSAPVVSFGVKTIFGLGGFTTNSIVVYLYNDGSSTKIRFLNSNSGTYQLIESTLPSFGSHHHILCVKDTASNKYYLYVNGSLVAQSIISINYVANNLGTNIGSFGNGFNGYNPFAGIIDEVGLWNRALTATEVTELYNAGAGKQYVAPTPTYTTRTAAFATATGITDTTILNALNTFDTGLISNGLATKMKALYPFVGGTANTHKYNFMDARDTNSAFRLTFNGGGLHSSTGYKPNGSNAYANTFLTPSANLSPTSSHISFYSRTNVSTTQVEMGVTTNNSDYYLIEINTSGTSYFAVNNAGIVSSSDSNSLGFYVANRPSSNLINGWKNSTKIATGVNSYNPSPSILPIFIGAWHENNTPMYYSTKECAFSSIGDGLTDSEAIAFYTLVQALQTSLSRQV